MEAGQGAEGGGDGRRGQEMGSCSAGGGSVRRTKSALASLLACSEAITFGEEKLYWKGGGAVAFLPQSNILSRTSDKMATYTNCPIRSNERLQSASSERASCQVLTRLSRITFQIVPLSVFKSSI